MSRPQVPLLQRIPGLIRESDLLPDSCWTWTGYLKRTQPVVRPAGARHASSARRAIYEEVIQPVAPGKKLKAACGNDACVNPYHMR